MASFSLSRQGRILLAVAAVYLLYELTLFSPWRKCCDDKLPLRPPHSLYTYLNASRALQPCSWVGRPHLRPNRSAHVCQAAAEEVAPFFEHLYKTLGIVVVARHGWALGSYRERGSIAGDCDGDVYLIIPKNLQKCCVVSLIQREAARFGRSRVFALSQWSTLTRLLYDGFDSWVMWAQSLDPSHPKARFGIDMDVLEERLIFEDDEYDRVTSERIGGLSPRMMFRNLCQCPLRSASLLCFESPVMERFLSHCYGPNFMTPGSGDCNADLTRKRWFWRTSLGSWLFNTASAKVSDFFVYIVG